VRERCECVHRIESNSASNTESRVTTVTRRRCSVSHRVRAKMTKEPMEEAEEAETEAWPRKRSCRRAQEGSGRGLREEEEKEELFLEKAVIFFLKMPTLYPGRLTCVEMETWRSTFNTLEQKYLWYTIAETYIYHT
jgi:hypothetical protein